MNLTGTFESAEIQFKQILEEFFIGFYDPRSLSSHGIDHHRRVWGYSKELLEFLVPINPAYILKLPSKLIIASYLHDIGMSVETGIRHGKHSRDICTQFLIKNKLPQKDFQDVLDAIENHDNKDYTRKSGTYDLLTVLSVADDLDAFGFTGIFRYTEIYLIRGINIIEIGYLIMENAEKRFDNFVKNFGYNEGLVKRHKKRYEILVSFFTEYNKEVPSYQFGSKYPSGYCGVVEIILYLINHMILLPDFYQEPEKYSHDPVIQFFFDELEKELFCV
jgi:hypothetical protein